VIFWSVVLGMVFPWRERRRRTEASVPSGDHLPSRTAVFPVPAQLPRGRGPDARPRIVSYESIRRWCLRFGQTYVNGLRRRKPRAGDKWHLDEVFRNVNGERRYLWRAVDQDGNVLDSLVQSKRDATAAKRFLARLLKKQRRIPRVTATYKLRSYGVAPPGADELGREPLEQRAEQPRREQAPAHANAR